ncbi:transketolase-like TK C-terminal-containing protein [Pseudomonas sessilinigenes]|uniref:Pyruvate dehydrogenase n=1 Tax=Pseudomonas sessilinigenes TaxID=658629 RepID=A0ABX8MMZ6_9PSED|nr:pyruvate dehydrogenase [Pseudomonas sessilinigenes]AZC26296.1 Pyruvate dehydrogenase E1 component [Pseudomonas sessilinigenes]QXH39688.1 pyruvate dehydrogenase [Pseudomonas sessilinigenes]
MMGFSSFRTSQDTGLAAQACIDKIQALSDQVNAGMSSPLYTMIDIANRLERDPGTAKNIWVVRSNQRPDTAQAHTRISAWPLRLSPRTLASEKPLLYLTSSSTSAQLCALSSESCQRGILCNDIETLPSPWPKGAHPWVPLWLSSNPHCLPFDPANGAEAQAIALAALKSLYVEGRDGFYYMALHDEPNDFVEPMDEHRANHAMQGMYQLGELQGAPQGPRVRLLGAGLSLRTVVAGARLLHEDWGVSCQLWSCPSYTRLARDADSAQRWNRMHPQHPRRSSHLRDCLAGDDSPVIAVTGYFQHVAEQIGAHVNTRFVALGADSIDSLSPGPNANHCLDKYWIAALALRALAQEGKVPAKYVKQAMQRYLLQ